MLTTIAADWLPMAAPDDIRSAVDLVPWQLAACRIDAPWQITGVIDGYHFSHAGCITRAAVSADGRVIATGGDDGAVRVWEPVYGREIFTVYVDIAPVSALALADDGRLLLAAGASGVVQAIDVATGLTLWSCDTPARARALAVDPRAHLLYVLGYDSRVRLLATTDGRPRRTLNLPRGTADALVVVRDGRDIRLVCGGFSGVTLIDPDTDPGPDTGNAGHVIAVSDGTSCRALALCPDDPHLVACAEGRDVILRRTADLSRYARIRAHDEPVIALTTAPGGRLVTAAFDDLIRMWDPLTGTLVCETTTGSPALALLPYRDGVLASSGHRLGHVELELDPDDARAPLTLPGPHNGRITALAADPSGRLLVSASADRTIAIHDIAAQRRIARHGGFNEAVRAITIDGHRRLIAATDAGQIRLMHLSGDPDPDPDPDAPLAPFEVRALADWQLPGDMPVRAVAFSARSRFAIALGDDGGVHRLPCAGGERRELYRIGNGGVALAISPDEQWIAVSAVDGSIHIVDATTGAIIFRPPADGIIAPALAFSPDGNRLLAARRDHQIRVWDLVTGQQLEPLPVPLGNASTIVAGTGSIQICGHQSPGDHGDYGPGPVWCEIDARTAEPRAHLMADLAAAGDQIDATAMLPGNRVAVATARLAILILGR
ncbi:MAG: WD40 repeat domain-containing protein [Planctomycetota bacterium]